jgi:hypothetical protein
VISIPATEPHRSWRMRVACRGGGRGLTTLLHHRRPPLKEQLLYAADALSEELERLREETISPLARFRVRDEERIDEPVVVGG